MGGGRMNLFSRTAALGLYQLRPGSVVWMELTVYQEALEPLLRRLDALERAPDPERAEPTALRRLCALCGLPAPEGLPEETLRRAAPALLRGAACTLEGLSAYLDALGVTAQCTDDPERRRVTAVVQEPAGLCPDVESLQRALERFLPAGTALFLDVGTLTWSLFEGAELTAGTLDALDFTWNWFDLHGHQLIE